MSLVVMGIKKGMMQIFNKKGDLVVCTVIHAKPNVISNVITKEKQGYNAVQLSAFESKNVTKPIKGIFASKNIAPRKKMKESRVEDPSLYSVGQEVGVGHFADCAYVDVCGVSKGKGYQGVIKRHNFSGGPGAHGSGFHRHGGSCGMRTSPGRCLPGQKKAGRMGAERVTVQSLKVVRVDEEKQVILVEGAIPGANESVVYVAKAKKKIAQVKKK